MPTQNRSRIRYYQGQPLQARDLQDEVAYEASMNSLHVTAMHNTWGAAVGLEVGLSQDRRAVIVGPGMAYDRCGRAIINPEPLTLDVPLPIPSPNRKPVIWWYDLTIRYHDTLDSASNDNLDCRHQGFASERLAWRWHDAGQAEDPAASAPDLAAGVRLGDEVPLARVVVDPGGTVISIDLSTRRSVQANVRPHIASGTAFVEATAAPNVMSWRTTINTSAAGFSSNRPQYFARLTEHPLRMWGSSAEIPAELRYPQTLRHLLGPFVTVVNPSRSAFLLDVRFAVADQAMVAVINRMGLPAKLPLKVSWHGMESTGGCQPPLPEIYFMPIYFMPVMYNMILFTGGGPG